MVFRKVRPVIALAIVITLLVTACSPAATPTPTPPAKAPAEKAPAEKAPAEKAPADKAPAPKPTAAPAKEGAPATPPPAAKPPEPGTSKPTGELPRSVTLATHSPGTTFYATGTGLAKVASDAGPMQVIVQPFTGPPAWIPQMTSAGKPETGIINAVEGWQAYTGKDTAKPLPEGMEIPRPYSKAWDGLRVLMMGTDMTVGLLVRKDSKYQTHNDLKGARVSWGFKAFPGCIVATLSNLALAGLTIKDVKPVDVPDTTAAVQALAEGRLDAACAAVGMGAVAEADAQVGVRYLNSPQDQANLLVAQGIMPGGKVVSIKAGSGAGLQQDTGIWGYGMAVLGSTKLPDNVAYTMVKTWWDNYQKLQPIHLQLREWTPDRFVSKTATMPYHTGAISFYKEKGTWTAEMDQNQQQLLKGELPFLK